MKNSQETNSMGSSSQAIKLPPISKPQSSHSKDLSKRSQSRQSNHLESLPDSLITTLIDGHRTQFTLSLKSQQLTIKCVNMKTNRKFITRYKHQQLPKAIQVTYKTLEELFEDIKYIVDENISNRLAIDEEGKLIFSLETKKKGKSEYLPEIFELQEQSKEKVIDRLQDQIFRLKEEDNLKSQKIKQLQKRLLNLQKIMQISPLQKSSNMNIQDQITHQKQFGTPLSTIQHQAHNEMNLPSNQSQISLDNSHLQTSQSIIKKFKHSKSTQNLQLKNLSEKSFQNDNSDNNTLIKTTIHDYDCFIEYEPDLIKVELLCRRQAKIYKTIIKSETIPKQVYSFVPTPKALFDEISYIIATKITNRLDVINNNFVYRASINAKNQQVLVDGVFDTTLIQQNDLERIEQLIDLRASLLQTSVKQLKIEMEMLKICLQSNNIILEMPQNFMDSKIVNNSSDFITLCRFFSAKILKISLLYRASQNGFDIKKFHDKCDGIPNTLTVILTEFDKAIGGFTSEQWDRNGNGQSKSDYQSHSFIFSLTNRHKFILEQHEHAIKTSGDDGPRFGNGADLVIKDKANENNNSYANICTSYTHSRYIYKNSESYKYFSGDDKTNRFRIKQWQVFEVFFDQ